MMNKLGFAIKLASQGAGNAIECNKGQWINKVVDIREYLKLFNGLQGTDNIVTFMSFDEGGCFLTQLRAISGRVGDFLSGWIYIPNTIDVSGEDVMDTYNYVRNILSQSNLSDDLKDNIESFFSKEYPLKEVVAQYSASKGQLYGVRFLNKDPHYYNLKEIVGKDRYQPYYSDYKAVFLLVEGEEVAIRPEVANSFKDLTKIEIVKTSILVPPSNATLQALGKGTKIHTIDGSDFNQPLLVNVGSKVPLILSRIGFENMKLEVNVTSERQDVDLSNVKITWMKKISSSMFTIRTRKNEKIDYEVRIFVNGEDITSRDVLLSEESCRQAHVKVSAPDFEDFEQNCNLLSGGLDITLSRKVKQSKAIVELFNGAQGKMTIESKYLPSKCESPLEGYCFGEDSQGNQVLRLSDWFVWKQRLWGFCAALIVGILLIAFTAFDAWIDTPQFKFGLPPWEEISTTQQDNSDSMSVDDTQNQNKNQGESEQNSSEDTSLEAAIKYLDNNSTWTKSKMEKFPDLKGLFDDMNNFNLSRLLNEWSTRLASSTRFKKICESAQKTYTNGWNPSQGSHNPTYNNPGDEQIRLTNYINWLDRDQTQTQTPPPSSNNGGFHPHVGANSGEKARKSDSKSGSKSGSKSDSKSGKSRVSSAKQGTGKSEKKTNAGL